MQATLILTFPETDTSDEVSRKSLENLSKQLGLSEVATVHRALRLLVQQRLVEVHSDDGPLSSEYREWLQNEANKLIEPGPRIWKKRLF